MQGYQRPLLLSCCFTVLLMCTSFTMRHDLSVNELTGKSYRIKTVVIDAGHGGHDTGCLGGSAREKNVALAVSLKLGKLIEDNFPDVKVIYTRKTDVFIELHERAAIANRNHADLFICVHCNSGPKTAYGVETFTMGLHKSDDNLTVSMRENSAILLEKDYKQKYDGYDPNSPESYIIFNLFQSAYIDKSLMLASKIQYQADAYGQRYSRGVKQAGFLVLYKTAMPSVLVETGFLTNAAEEKFLASDKGQVTMANVIYRAFKEYKVDTEEGEGGKETDSHQPEKKTETPVEKKEPVTEKPVTVEKKSEVVEPKKVDSVKDVPKNIEVKKAEIDSSALLKPVQKKVVIEKPKADSIPKKTETVKTDSTIIKKAREADKAPHEIFDDGLYYTVQIGASATATDAEKKHFNVDGMKIIKADGMNRFTVGHYNTPEEANEKMKQLKQSGFKDAFVTPYYNGKRITMAEAKKIR